jgi:two-component system sensor histidine kinase DegS
VRIVHDPDEMILTFWDDGKGFSVPPNLSQLVSEDHFGLVGMREWIEVVNGSLEIQSENREGTKITARVPIGSQKNSTMI